MCFIFYFEGLVGGLLRFVYYGECCGVGRMMVWWVVLVMPRFMGGEVEMYNWLLNGIGVGIGGIGSGVMRRRWEIRDY